MVWNRESGSQWFTTDDLPGYKIRDVYEEGDADTGYELRHRDQVIRYTTSFREAEHFARIHQLVSANITQLAPRVASGDGWDDIAEDYGANPRDLALAWLSIMG